VCNEKGYVARVPSSSVTYLLILVTDFIKAIAQAPRLEQPSEEDIEGIINKVIYFKSSKAVQKQAGEAAK
jgi:hypothetical protein